jgi:succinate dehydrogenase / fumarate reductase cytochrome b subunit
MNLLLRPVHPPSQVRSSLGTKYVMALTGLGLIGFVLGHMGGNLLIFAGPDYLNGYAQHLKETPALLWPARVGLLAIFLLHVVLGLRLAFSNRAARPSPYHYPQRFENASWAARHMLLTGLLLLAFVVYHLAHFTFGAVVRADVQQGSGGEVVKVDKNYLQLVEVRPAGSQKYEPRPSLTPAQAEADHLDYRQDVYSMVLSGFRNPLITGSYLVFMVCLWLHLWHGGSSWFQSLGLNNPRYNPALRAFGPVIATLVLIGNCAIPLAVLLGAV